MFIDLFSGLISGFFLGFFAFGFSGATLVCFSKIYDRNTHWIERLFSIPFLIIFLVASLFCWFLPLHGDSISTLKLICSYIGSSPFIIITLGYLAAAYNNPSKFLENTESRWPKIF